MEKPLRVLIVEDSEDDTVLLLRHLERFGYRPEAERVETGDELQSALRKSEWDLIITDYVLPGFSGLEALEVLKNKSLDIPCIVVSGKITDEMAVNVLRAGARDYIAKDNLSRLGPAVERELNEAKSRQELNRVEAQLRESQRRYQEIVETAGEGIWTTDAGGNTTFVNRRMAEIIGYNPEDLIGKPGLDYCLPEYHSVCQEANRRISLGERQYYEIELSGKGGSRIWVGVNGSPFYDHQGNYIGNLGLYNDISEQRAAQEKLLRSQQQLEGLFQNMAEGVILLDVDGKVLKINPVAARTLHLDSEKVPGTYYDSLLWQGEVALEGGTIISREILSQQKLSSLGRTIINEEASLKLPDGTLTWLRGSIAPQMDSQGVNGTIVTFTDITREKMQQEQLTQMLLEGQEQERKRIARELHDDTAQSQSLISLELDSVISRENLCDEETMAKITRQKSAVDRTMQDVRRFSHELHPSILDHLGLVPALDQLVEEMNQRNDMAVSFTTRGNEKKLSSAKELAVFRVVQEALSNIRKHARATQAEVSLQYLSDSVKLRISDNGTGFDIKKESEAAISRGSLGLVSMRERAHLIGAELKIESRLGQGTSITMKMALDRSEVDQTRAKY